MNYNIDFDPALMEMGANHAKNTLPLAELINLTGKNVIVTGGTTGLGYAITNRLAEAGAKVVIVGRSAEKGAIAEKQFRDRGLDVTYCQADITVVAECEKVVAFTEEKCGPVDILVNNAARWIFSAVLDQEEELYDQVMDLNVKALYFMTKYAARSMVKHGRIGKVVNIASTACIGQDNDGACLLTSYNASKGAVVSLTIGMAKELRQYGINVNCVAPGGMDTYGNEYESVNLENYMCEYGWDMMEPMEGNFDMPYCNPDEVALTVFTYCTDLTNYVVGETVKASGGSHLSFQQKPFTITMELPENYEPPRKQRIKRDGTMGKNNW